MRLTGFEMYELSRDWARGIHVVGRGVYDCSGFDPGVSRFWNGE